MSDSLGPHGLESTRLLCPWDSPGKDTAVGCHAFLQGIFPTQGSNPHLLCLNAPVSLQKGGIWAQKQIGKTCEETQGDNGHLQAKERVQDSAFPHSPAHTLTPGLQEATNPPVSKPPQGGAQPQQSSLTPVARRSDALHWLGLGPAP